MNTRLNMWSEMYLDMIKIEMVAYHINNLQILVLNNILDKWLFKDFIEKVTILMDLAE